MARADGAASGQAVPSTPTPPSVPAPGDAVTLNFHRSGSAAKSLEMRFDLSSVHTFTWTRSRNVLKRLSRSQSVSADFVLGELSGRHDGKVSVFVKRLSGSGFAVKDASQVRCQGTAIILSRLPHLTFSRVDGRTLTGADIACLSAIFRRNAGAGGSDDNRLLDVNHPVRIGDTWQPDKALLAQIVSDYGEILVDPNDTDAQVTFTKRAMVDGLDSAIVTLSARSDEIRIPSVGDRVKDPAGTLTMALSEVVPISSGSPVLGQSIDADVDYTGIVSQDGVVYHAEIVNSNKWSIVKFDPADASKIEEARERNRLDRVADRRF